MLDSCAENISVKHTDHSKTIKRVISPLMNSSSSRSSSSSSKVISLQAWCGPEGGERYNSTLP